MGMRSHQISYVLFRFWVREIRLIDFESSMQVMYKIKAIVQ
jgi:hypothetical protein